MSWIIIVWINLTFWSLLGRRRFGKVRNGARVPQGKNGDLLPPAGNLCADNWPKFCWNGCASMWCCLLCVSTGLSYLAKYHCVSCASKQVKIMKSCRLFFTSIAAKTTPASHMNTTCRNNDASVVPPITTLGYRHEDTLVCSSLRVGCLSGEN